MVHQIYIQVNTSDHNMTFSGESISQAQNHSMKPMHHNKDGLRVDSLHSPNATPNLEAY